MSIGTLSRANLMGVLSSVLQEALPDVETVAHIRLDAAPQGLEHRGYAWENVRARDDVSRKRRNTHVLKRYTFDLRYAHRLGMDFLDDRVEAADDVDRMERALRNSTQPNTADYSCVDFEDTQTVDPTGEWILYNIAVEILCQIRLRDPDAVPESLE